MRDYLHVLDLAKGHLLALDALAPESHAFDNCPGEARYKAYNLGKGRGMSVLQIVEAMRKATGFDFKYEIVGRRCVVYFTAIPFFMLIARDMFQTRRRAGPDGRSRACREGARVQGCGRLGDDVQGSVELADEESERLRFLSWD